MEFLKEYSLCHKQEICQSGYQKKFNIHGFLFLSFITPGSSAGNPSLLSGFTTGNKENHFNAKDPFLVKERIHFVVRTGLLRGSELSVILQNLCTNVVEQANFVLELFSLKASDNLCFGLLKVLGVNWNIVGSSSLYGLQCLSHRFLLGNICV